MVNVPVFDLSGFETKIGPFSELREMHDMAWSDTSHLFVGGNGSLDFRVDFDYYFDRPTDSTGGEEVEQDTLHVHYLGVSSGHGLGSVVASALIDHVKERGIHAGRMGIINPRVIGIIGKLQKIGIIQASYFRLERGIDIRPLPPTVTIKDEPDLLVPEVASSQLAIFQEEIEARERSDRYAPEDCVYIDCAIFF